MVTVLVVVLGPVVIVALNEFAKWLAERGPKPVLPRRRPSDPQRGAATGTGVERGPLRATTDADLAALPRSPSASTGAAAPRPDAPVGLNLPAAVADPHVTAAGVQRGVVWHG